MKILMLGTGPFAVPTFRWLLDSDHDVPALFTQPPRPTRGRGKTPPNPMREVAQERGIAVHTPEKFNAAESLQLVRGYAPDLLMVCDYGQILSDEALQLARLGGINLHGSLLPKYRGAAPVQWAVYHGETTTGVTVIHMTAGLDAGPSLVQIETPIAGDETSPELEHRLAEIGVQAVQQALAMLESWDGQAALGIVQDATQATKAPRLKKSDGHIDWNRAAEQIYDQVRALKPWPASHTLWHKPGEDEPRRLILDQVEIADGFSQAPQLPGTVVCADGNSFQVATGTGTLAIHRLQPAGKRLMSTEDFLRGAGMQVGDRFE